MSIVAEAFAAAVRMIANADPALAEIALLSLRVSGTATVIATLVALPVAAWVAQSRSRMRGAIVLALNASMAFPPVIVGLIAYLLLSRSGPLGAFGWLFTPNGMIFAQTMLIAPIIAALARQTLEDANEEYRDLFRSLALTPWQRTRALLFETRYSLLVLLLAGFGRAIAEVGAVMMVGGNIAGHTRVMTTAIALETSKGELALAMALGVVLLVLVLIVNAVAQLSGAYLRRRYV